MTSVVNIRDLPESWTDDADYVFVGRPSVYGNQHRVGMCFVCNRSHDRYEAVRLHAEEAREKFRTDMVFRAAVEKLRGKKLACFCKRPDVEVPCHADIYVELSGTT